MSGKGTSRETVEAMLSSETWAVWVKLDCLKSSGELETVPSLDTTVKVKTRQQRLTWCRGVKSFWSGTWSMRPIKPRTDALTRPTVTYDRTTGSPSRREPHGDGDPIVVGGVTTTHGGWAHKPATGRRGSGLVLGKTERYAKCRVLIIFFKRYGNWESNASRSRGCTGVCTTRNCIS